VANAEFLHNEMPGITLSAEALDRMRRAGAEGGAAEGIAVVYDVLAACRHLVAGAYIMPQFDRYDMAARLVERIRTGEG
jgi:homocysteine S-methyltransferase